MLVVSWDNMPLAFFDHFMNANPDLVVSWRTVAAAGFELARKHPQRVCLLSAFEEDAIQAKREFLAMKFDEKTACTLVGTQMASRSLRSWALGQILCVQFPHKWYED
jgi:hypothetical protein